VITSMMTTPELQGWIAAASAVVTPIAAILAACFAWPQWADASRKAREERYGRLSVSVQHAGTDNRWSVTVGYRPPYVHEGFSTRARVDPRHGAILETNAANRLEEVQHCDRAMHVAHPRRGGDSWLSANFTVQTRDGVRIAAMQFTVTGDASRRRMVRRRMLVSPLH
jgi:hypothetical protein